MLDDRRMALLGGFESLLSEDIEDLVSSADFKLALITRETEGSCSEDGTGAWSAYGSWCAPRLVSSVSMLVAVIVCLHAAAAAAAAAAEDQERIGRMVDRTRTMARQGLNDRRWQIYRDQARRETRQEIHEQAEGRRHEDA